MPRIAIVAALEREVRPLLRHWRLSQREYQGRFFRFFESGDAVLVCGGIGDEAARRAAEAVIATFHPRLVYSIGFAGALDPRLNVGDLARPARVVNAGDGSSVDVEGGDGVLVSFRTVASPAQKARLQEAFGAHFVDMEAAAVARASQIHGAGFATVKAISDPVDFEFPAIERFVDDDGQFAEFRFAWFALLRPWLWTRVLRLARNSKRASRALCAWLRDLDLLSNAEYSDGTPLAREKHM